MNRGVALLAVLVVTASGCSRAPGAGGTISDFDRDHAACAKQPDPHRCLVERGGLRAPMSDRPQTYRGFGRSPKDED
jgi:hypothetical protein